MSLPQILSMVTLLATLLMPTLASAEEASEAPASADAATIKDIVAAILLPGLAERARETGVPEEDIQLAINVSKKEHLPAQETGEILEATTVAVEEHGPVDNFGAFVTSLVGQGLRGRDLAQAIRAEHAARGIGKGNMREHPGNKGRGELGQPIEEDHGRPEGAGKTKNKGKNKGDSQ